jgi:hypothetical protein
LSLIGTSEPHAAFFNESRTRQPLVATRNSESGV